MRGDKTQNDKPCLTRDQKVTYNEAMTDDPVFKALADPTRRFLLDQLFERDGRTLTELESGLEMSRFGVMKHLRVLEEAGLVVTRRSGREKLHYLNPVPIRLIHDRWISKYRERHAAALADLKRELEGVERMPAQRESVPTQVYVVYIKATPEAIWDAITKPEWNRKYGYGAPAEYELRPGGAYRALASEQMKQFGAPDVIIDGQVLEVDPPRRLVQTYRILWDPELKAEGFTKVTWEIGEPFQGVTKLTVTHELDGAPKVAAQVGGKVEQAGGGWSMVLSDLKSLLETGKPLFG